MAAIEHAISRAGKGQLESIRAACHGVRVGALRVLWPDASASVSHDEIVLRQ